MFSGEEIANTRSVLPSGVFPYSIGTTRALAALAIANTTRSWSRKFVCRVPRSYPKIASGFGTPPS